jgi:hypothetical protein
MPRTGARVTRRSARSAKQARGKVDPVAEALRWLQEKRATQVKIAGVDLDGVLRGKYVSLDKFASVAGAGLGFCDVVFGWDLADELYDNAQVTGWHTGYPDLQARVDLSTARMIPWEPATAAFLLDFVMPDGSDYAPSPRALLRRVGHRARSMGFLPSSGASTSSSSSRRRRPRPGPRASRTWSRWTRACSATPGSAPPRARTWCTRCSTAATPSGWRWRPSTPRPDPGCTRRPSTTTCSSPRVTSRCSSSRR